MKFTNSVNYIRLINFVVESILEFFFLVVHELEKNSEVIFCGFY